MAFTLGEVKAIKKGFRQVYESGDMGFCGLCRAVAVKLPEHIEPIRAYTFIRVLAAGPYGRYGDFNEHRQTLCCIIMALSNKELLEVVNAPV